MLNQNYSSSPLFRISFAEVPIIFLVGRSIIEFFTFSSPGIRNYLKLFTGSILDVLEIILWQSLCDTIHLSLYRDSVTVQAENLSGILELLLAVTMQLCSLLGRIVYFHCSLYYYEIIVHLLVFSLLYAYIYIYDICMS